MKVQARIALDGGGVYAVEVEPEELTAQLSDDGSNFLVFEDPQGFTTLIPREKVLMVQFGAGIPSPQQQEAEQQAQFQQLQNQFAQMQQQYAQMQAQAPVAAQPQPSFGDRAKARFQQFQEQLMPQQSPYPLQQPQQQQYPPIQQQSQYPTQW